MLQIAINTGLINSFLSQPADQMLLSILLSVGWIPIAATLLWGARELWMDYINNQWGGMQKDIMLAIDIPKANEQGVEAVENLFTYFGGAHGSINLIEKYWEGKFQVGFSFEIVSIDGYTQFLIRTPENFRNLVESAVYSQYPDAEITEVRDYVDAVPSMFPNDEWDIWGAEFIQHKVSAYPIRLYKDFYTTTGPAEIQFKDPMASLMDLCSSLKKGEQLWFQILVTPRDMDWVKDSEVEVKKILREKIAVKKGALASFFELIFGELMSLINEALHQIGDMFLALGGTAATEKTDDSLKMMNLKPKEKKQIEAIQAKAAKQGFDCKLRFIYAAKKDVMNKPKVGSGFVGYMKQFIDIDLNNLKPDMAKTGTSPSYFFKDYRAAMRKRKLMRGYKERSSSIGRKTGVYNIEELATLWHFPIEASVKAPLIQKAPGRKAEPPMTLPLGESAADDAYRRQSDLGEDIFVLDEKPQARSAGANAKKTGSSLPPASPDGLNQENKSSSLPGNLPFAD